MAQLLWRIEGVCEEPNRAGWAEGVALHLRFQPLTLVLARRAGQTRRYLALAGCPHCRADGCDRMCHRTLFSQLVHTTLPGVTLTPATRLPPHPSETRRFLARPVGASAAPLDEGFLGAWAEGRIITTWSCVRVKSQPVVVGARVALSATGPDPAPALRERGWALSAVGTFLARVAFQAPIPPQVQHGTQAGEALLQSIRDPWGLLGAPPVAAIEE